MGLWPSRIQNIHRREMITVKTTTKKTMGCILATVALVVAGCSTGATEAETTSGQAGSHAPVEAAPYWAAHDNGVLEHLRVISGDAVVYQMLRCSDGHLAASDVSQTSFGTFDGDAIDFGDAAGYYGRRSVAIEQTDDGEYD